MTIKQQQQEQQQQEQQQQQQQQEQQQQQQEQQQQQQQQQQEQQQQQQQPGSAYESIIAQQAKQIDALIAQADKLNRQIVEMMGSGVQFNDGLRGKAESAGGNQNGNAGDADFSLESLGREIGKPRKA